MTETLKTLEGVATVVIAIYLASLGTFQCFTRQDKLRLDLYDRRFEVYLCALDFMAWTPQLSGLSPGKIWCVSVKDHQTLRERIGSRLN